MRLFKSSGLLLSSIINLHFHCVFFVLTLLILVSHIFLSSSEIPDPELIFRLYYFLPLFFIVLPVRCATDFEMRLKTGVNHIFIILVFSS